MVDEKVVKEKAVDEGYGKAQGEEGKKRKENEEEKYVCGQRWMWIFASS